MHKRPQTSPRAVMRAWRGKTRYWVVRHQVTHAGLEPATKGYGFLGIMLSDGRYCWKSSMVSARV